VSHQDSARSLLDKNYAEIREKVREKDRKKILKPDVRCGDIAYT